MLNHRSVAGAFSEKPDNILKKFYANEEEANWALQHILQEGPPDKQLRNNLVMISLGETVRKVAEAIGSEPAFTPGVKVKKAGPHHPGFEFPIEISEPLLTKINAGRQEEVLYEMGHGPAHDILRDLLILRAFEFINNSVNQTVESHGSEQ